MNKNIIRAGIVFFVVAAASAGFLYFSDYFAKYFGSGERPQSEAEKYFYEMEKLRAADTFGGSTPEETLQLFIDALKAGDIDLASKYFVVEKQGEMRNQLEAGKNNNSLNNFLIFLNYKKYGKELDVDRFVFTFSDNSEVLMSIDLVLNPSTKKWKIESL